MGGHAAPRKATRLGKLLERCRGPFQILLTFVLGLLLPFAVYVAVDHWADFDISPYLYLSTVIILVATALVVWVECFLALFPTTPPAEPGRPYPPASAIIAAYLPNEADTILDTIQAFLDLEYPAPLQVVLAYNSPKDMPEIEGLLQEIGRRRPDRFVPYRVMASRSKAENVNAALDHVVTGEFVAVFDADHQPMRDAFTRAWKWLSTGYDVVQGHCLVRNGDDGFIAQAVAVEFECIYSIGHPGAARLHDFGIFGGSNGFWKTSLLQEIKMDKEMLTEDIDSSIRVLLKGGKIKSDPGLISTELATTTIPQIWKQRLRWAQGWFQVSMKHFVPGMLCRHLSLWQKVGLFHLFLWREVYPWVSLQILPLLAFLVYKESGLGAINWLDSFYLATTIFTFSCGPGQMVMAYVASHKSIKKRGWWWFFNIWFSMIFYTEFKNVIARVAHIKEFMKEKSWVVTPRQVKKAQVAAAIANAKGEAVQVVAHQ
eukprot:SM000028S10042  [mRNA]  locus=s28:66460:68045:- [translate_table: standard]